MLKKKSREERGIKRQSFRQEITVSNAGWMQDHSEIRIRIVYPTGHSYSQERRMKMVAKMTSKFLKKVRRVVIKRQHLGTRKISENPFQSAVTAHDSRPVLCPGDVGIPSEDLLVKRNDRHIEITLRNLSDPLRQGAVMWIGRALQDANVIRVKDIHQGSLGIGSIGLSDLAAKSQDFVEFRIVFEGSGNLVNPFSLGMQTIDLSPQVRHNLFNL